MNCTLCMHLQASDCSGTSSVSELGAEQEFGVNAQGLTLSIVDLWKHWHQSLRLLMWAQILRAGPSLMFMVDMRCSSFSSSRAWPSISCDRNWEASSSQPAKRNINRKKHGEEATKSKIRIRGKSAMTSNDSLIIKMCDFSDCYSFKQLVSSSLQMTYCTQHQSWMLVNIKTY